MSDVPPVGLYESILTSELAKKLEEFKDQVIPAISDIDRSEAARLLSRHFQGVLERALNMFPAKEVGVVGQVEICNRLLLVLQKHAEGHDSTSTDEAPDLLTSKLLIALMARQALSEPRAPQRPTFPLTETHLLTNARGEHQIGYELERELKSAERVDLLCSFLLWSGYIQLKPSIQEFFQRPAARMRVITTVYLGATNPRVLEDLHKLGAQVRINYDTRRTRLHAKAWLIGRDSGFTTAFIGSSNLSAAALTDGLEWNVRVGGDTPNVLEKFRTTFEGYWNDPAFEPYDPGRDSKRLMAALATAKHGREFDVTYFDLRPLPFQAAILEHLEVERSAHGRRRNLVVAATGTGKTVIAAFDFERLREEFKAANGRYPNLLFVAHRRELLEQARKTFRHVLRDGRFGEFLVDGERPTSNAAVFASIQSLAQVRVDSIDPRAWDVVIVDEFHHAAADTYARWLDYLVPWTLLGLTATPERADGQSILHWFDGHQAVTLRLWDAIEQGLLAPFRYFALKDEIDLGLYWRRDRGQFDWLALDGVLTGHHARAQQVLNAVIEHVENPYAMKAVGFCVGRGHARFMAQYFESKGIKAATVLGDDEDRAQRIQQLQAGELQVLFTVDVLSEGVDIPNMDTALFLRPTESPTVFLQQLGRGLRLAEGKRELTVLDLVASPAREFRIERRYQALLGASRREIEAQINQGFPHLPAGCSVRLTDDARELILESLRQAIASRTAAVLSELKRLGPNTTLRELLDDTGLTLQEFYRRRTLTALRREAGFELRSVGPDEELLNNRLPRIVGFDDIVAIEDFLRGLGSESPPTPSARWRLLLVALFGEEAIKSPEVSMARLWQHPALRRELAELLECSADRVEYPQFDLDLLDVPLRVHCHYQRREIEAALIGEKDTALPNGREGVWFFKERKVDALFVQLQKSEKDFSPSTMYKDYALSMDRFHWQSQASTKASHEKGQRNLRHREKGITPLLFVRVEEKDERGETCPYLFLGPVEYESHEGEQPISIVWRLQTPMPASFFEAARVAV